MDRGGLDARPADVAGDPVARADRERLGIEPGQREPAGEPCQVERPPGVVEELVAADVFLGREILEGASARDAVELRGRLVGVDDLVVGRLDRDRVGDAVEHHAQLLGEQARAPARRLELGHVLEGHHRHAAAAGQHDRGTGGHHGAHARRRLPVDLFMGQRLAARDAHGRHLVRVQRLPRGVIEPVRARVVLGRDAERERAARQPVGRGVRVQRPGRARLDQEQRNGQNVEDRLDVDEAAPDGGREGRLHSHRSAEPTPQQTLTRALRPRTRAGSPRRGGGGPPRRAGWR